MNAYRTRTFEIDAEPFESIRFVSILRIHGWREVSHFRIGRFAVCLIARFDDSTRLDLAAKHEYPDHLEDKDLPKSRHWRSWVSERSDALIQAEQALQPEHPLYAELKADIAKERAYLAQ